MILGVFLRGDAGERRNGGRGKRIVPPVLAAFLLTGAVCGPTLPVKGADSPAGPQADAPYGGVACSIGQPFWVPSRETAETLPWPAVYLGHFSGGRPFRDPEGRTLIDWRDEYVCFPSSGQCRAWVRDSYRTHHAPEGYRACLLLR
jgi:hypothetical protein